MAQIHNVKLENMIALSFSYDPADENGTVYVKENFDEKIEEISDDFWGGEDKW